MDETPMTEEEAALQRARLHIRAARNRLRQDKLAAGVGTLYDAFYFAMRWCVLRRGDELEIRENDDFSEPGDLFQILARSNVLDRSFHFQFFEALLEETLEDEIPTVDWQSLMDEMERAMTALGVMPFDEKALLPEDPFIY
jgi:hypothetical protein